MAFLTIEFWIEFIKFYARIYLFIGMIVVTAVWAWHWIGNIKQKKELGPDFKLKPFGLNRYLWIWIWWPGFVKKVIKAYREKREK